MNAPTSYALTSILLLGLAGSAAADRFPDPDESMTPGDRARMELEAGMKYRDAAVELEAEAATETDAKKRDKLATKAQKKYEKAIDRLQRAVEIDPRLFPAFGSLGFTLRKTGRYEEALDAYDRALEIEPRYTEAIEYRAEAYLALDRLEEAGEAYMLLFRVDRPRADKLMDAMQAWIAEHRDAPGGVAAQRIEEFAQWVDERATIASRTEQLASGESTTGSW